MESYFNSNGHETRLLSSSIGPARRQFVSFGASKGVAKVPFESWLFGAVSSYGGTAAILEAGTGMAVCRSSIFAQVEKSARSAAPFASDR